MQVAPVAGAVRLVSEAVGTTPVKLYGRDPKAPAPDHPSYALAHDFANDWTSAAALRTTLTADAMLRGHGYAQAIVVNGRVQEFYYLDPCLFTVTRKQRELTGEPFYEVRNGAHVFTVPFYEMLHVSDFDEVASIQRGREAISLSALLERHTSKFFAKGARPSSIVFFNKTIPPEQLSRIRDAWNEQHAGDNAGGTAFIDKGEGGSFQTVTPSAQASELTQQRQHQVIEIARHFSVPPPMLFALERATWSRANSSTASSGSSLFGRGYSAGSTPIRACCSPLRSAPPTISSSSKMTSPVPICRFRPRRSLNGAAWAP